MRLFIFINLAIILSTFTNCCAQNVEIKTNALDYKLASDSVSLTVWNNGSHTIYYHLGVELLYDNVWLELIDNLDNPNLEYTPVHTLRRKSSDQVVFPMERLMAIDTISFPKRIKFFMRYTHEPFNSDNLQKCTSDVLIVK